jgi:hypothetical protein
MCYLRKFMEEILKAIKEKTIENSSINFQFSDKDDERLIYDVFEQYNSWFHNTKYLLDVSIWNLKELYVNSSLSTGCKFRKPKINLSFKVTGKNLFLEWIPTDFKEIDMSEYKIKLCPTMFRQQRYVPKNILFEIHNFITFKQMLPHIKSKSNTYLANSILDLYWNIHTFLSEHFEIEIINQLVLNGKEFDKLYSNDCESMSIIPSEEVKKIHIKNERIRKKNELKIWVEEVLVESLGITPEILIKCFLDEGKVFARTARALNLLIREGQEINGAKVKKYLTKFVELHPNKYGKCLSPQITINNNKLQKQRPCNVVYIHTPTINK